MRYVQATISHPDVQLYSSSLRIHALLGGIRYYLYNWWLAGIYYGEKKSFPQFAVNKDKEAVTNLKLIIIIDTGKVIEIQTSR